MQITGSEATILSAVIGAGGYCAIMFDAHHTKAVGDDVREIKDSLTGLQSTLAEHTAADAEQFGELRGLMPRRRRGWMLPALSVLVHLFLR